MSKMLGEELVERGVITESHLDKALKAQLIHGGHLGTCLIELGCIDEQELGETLADILAIPLAEPAMFHSIPAPVLEALPRDLVEKHRVVPLRIEGRTLHVAMVAPKDLAVIDELQFATGHAISAWIAPEVRIVLALENYYGVPRSRRYLLLSPDPRRKAARAKKPTPVPAAPPEVAAPEVAAPKVAAPKTPTSAVVDIESDLMEDERYARAQSPIWSDLGLESDYAKEPLKTLSDQIDRLDDAMCAATNPDELGASVLDCVSLGLKRSILFRVHQLVARIWDSRGFGNLVEDSNQAGVPVTEEPLFQLISENGSYRGPVIGVPKDRGLYHELGIKQPREVLLLPVYAKDHLVAVLYGDSGAGEHIDGELAEYQRVANKIAPALELQALERKLRRI